MSQGQSKEQVWVEKVKKLLHADRAKDERLLKAVGAQTETRKATASKLEDMLVKTGRAKGKGDEKSRAANEETFLHGVSERMEQAANVTFIGEDVADVLADGNVRPAPVKPGILNSFPTEALAPASQQATWRKKKAEYDQAVLEYTNTQNNLNALKAKVDTAFNELKTNNADQVDKVKADIKRKHDNLGDMVSPSDIEAETEKQLRRVLVMNELDAEISGEVAKYDAANKGVDPETRSDAVAKIIETIGEKYGYTNLAHFISRHGAARINPATGAAKRTDADFVSRLATGVGPDRKPDAANMPADKITETIDGTSVDVPVYAKAGYETASGASQHASAKAALYMIEEAMAEAALINELFDMNPRGKIDVIVGKENLDGQKLGSYNEPGKLGKLFKLKGAVGVPKLTTAKRGQPLVRSEIEQRVQDAEVVHDQTSAKVTLLADKMLGGYNVMTMFSQTAGDAQIDYQAAGSTTSTPLLKTSANVDAARKVVMGQLRDEIKQEKVDAENEFNAAKLVAESKQAEVTVAAKAVDDAVGKLPAEKQEAAKQLKKLIEAEVQALQKLNEAETLVKGLSDEAARRTNEWKDAAKQLETKKNDVAQCKSKVEKGIETGAADLPDLKRQMEEAELAYTVSNMQYEEMKDDADQFEKLLTAQTEKRDASRLEADKATKARTEAEKATGLEAAALGELKSLLATLETKQKEAAKLAATRDTCQQVAEFFKERHADAARQFDIADLGLAEVLRRELEKEWNDAKAALKFDAGKESQEEYQKRLEAYGNEQREKIAAQRELVKQDMESRATHGQEVHDERNPKQTAFANLDKLTPTEALSGNDPDAKKLSAQIERIRGLILSWQIKADAAADERKKNAEQQIKVQAEYAKLQERAKAGDDVDARMAELVEEIEMLRSQAGVQSHKENVARNNMVLLRERQQALSEKWRGMVREPLKAAAEAEKKSPTPQQKSTAKAESTAKVLDDLRLAQGMANIDRAEAELELQLAEAAAALPGAGEIATLTKACAELKKTLVESQARLAAAKVAEQDLKTKYEKLKAVADEVNKLVAANTLPATEPRVVDLNARLSQVKAASEAATLEVAAADTAVKDAQPKYEQKQKELDEKKRSAGK